LGGCSSKEVRAGFASRTCHHNSSVICASSLAYHCGSPAFAGEDLACTPPYKIWLCKTHSLIRQAVRCSKKATERRRPTTILQFTDGQCLQAPVTIHSRRCGSPNSFCQPPGVILGDWRALKGSSLRVSGLKSRVDRTARHPTMPNQLDSAGQAILRLLHKTAGGG
jgi:hypothetical protein